MRHKLSNIKQDTMTADCSVCGTVKIYTKTNPAGYRCSLKAKSYKQLSVEPKILYLIKADNGLTKIGVADNLDKRFRILQYISPCQLVLEFTASVEVPFKKERELHDRFAEKRSHGEWFDLSEEEIKWAKNFLSH